MTVAYGEADFWLFKVAAATGDLRWETTIGTTGEDSPRGVREVTLPSGDLEYMIVGSTRGPKSGNVTESISGVSDVLIGQYIVAGPTPGTLPTPNPQGTTFGGNGIESGYGFVGDLLIGTTDSLAGADVAGTTPRGWNDIFIKSASGVVRFGGNQHELIEEILPDGVFVGRTGSNSDDVTCNQHDVLGGVGELWIGKLAATGLVQSTCFGSDGTDEAYGVAKLQNGGYVVVGSGTTGGDITATGSGALVVFVDASLSVTKHYFRPVGDGRLNAVAQTASGRIVAVGSTGQQSGAFMSNHGGSDLWIAELAP